jgi:Cysteine-rich CPXCG/Domain of unknown function (DUF309)
MQPLEETVRAGLERFQRGNLHAAQEAWEEGWTQATGAERHLLQSLVQLAAGFQQWSRGMPEGAAMLFARARGHLEAIPSALLGVEVSELEFELEAFEEAATRREAPPATTSLGALNPPAPAAPMQRHPHRCPYCGERVTVQADAVGSTEESYVEDCPVCCRPWTVCVSRDGDAVEVSLKREDD